MHRARGQRSLSHALRAQSVIVWWHRYSNRYYYMRTRNHNILVRLCPAYPWKPSFDMRFMDRGLLRNVCISRGRVSTLRARLNASIYASSHTQVIPHCGSPICHPLCKFSSRKDTDIIASSMSMPIFAKKEMKIRKILEISDFYDVGNCNWLRFELYALRCFHSVDAFVFLIALY